MKESIVIKYGFKRFFMKKQRILVVSSAHIDIALAGVPFS